MGKILEALASDNLCITPTIYKGNSEYRKAIKVMHETSEELDKKLNDEEKKILKQFCDAQDKENQIYQMERFIRGYRLGILMMLEVFDETSDLILGEADI